MKRLLFPAVLLSCIISCNDQPKTEEPAAEATPRTPQVKVDNITYKDDTTTLQGMVAYDANDSARRPAILVVPEWWGVVNFTRSRAEELAKLGYIAMVVDMYGNGKVAENPGDAGKMAMPFYQNPQMATKRIEAALNEVKKYPQTDTSRIAAIGFCFGGTMVLNAANLGGNFDAVVSFHGGLEGVRPPAKNLPKAKLLVCHGGNDSFVPQRDVDAFKKQMDSVDADYQFIVYPDATHAFTNPDATETGKKFNLPIAYNAAADSASWKDMKEFFGKNLR
jgi:dienelactone hydrolase